MAIADRRLRDGAPPRRLIIATARALPNARARTRSPPAGCPPRSSTASQCSTSTSHRWRTSWKPSHWRVSANSPRSCARPERGAQGRRVIEQGHPRLQQLRRRQPRAVRRDVHPRHTTAIGGTEDARSSCGRGSPELREAVADVAGSGRGRPHRGAVGLLRGLTARTQRPATPGPRHRTHRTPGRPVLRRQPQAVDEASDGEGLLGVRSPV